MQNVKCAAGLRDSRHFEGQSLLLCRIIRLSLYSFDDVNHPDLWKPRSHEDCLLFNKRRIHSIIDLFIK